MGKGSMSRGGQLKGKAGKAQTVGRGAMHMESVRAPSGRPPQALSPRLLPGVNKPCSLGWPSPSLLLAPLGGCFSVVLLGSSAAVSLAGALAWVLWGGGLVFQGTHEN